MGFKEQVEATIEDERSSGGVIPCGPSPADASSLVAGLPTVEATSSRGFDRRPARGVGARVKSQKAFAVEPLAREGQCSIKLVEDCPQSCNSAQGARP